MPKLVEQDLPDPGPLRPEVPVPGSKFRLSRNRHFVARQGKAGTVMFCRVMERRTGKLMRCEVINGGWGIIFDEDGNGFERGTREASVKIESVFPASLKEQSQIHYNVAIGWSAQAVRAAAAAKGSA